jgi:hypothetical protein
VFMCVVCVCVCVFDTLVTQHAMRMRHVDNCSLSVPAIFFPHYLTNGTIFGKKSYWTQNVCFDFLYNVCPKHFSFYEEFDEILS